MPVNIGTAVDVVVGKGVLVLAGVMVGAGTSLIGLGVANELQPTSKKRIANDEI